MNKSKVDEWLPKAYDLIEEKISNNGQVDKGYRGQISAFGVAIQMGSILSAIAFFGSEQSNAKVDRKKILEIIQELIHPEEGNLLKYAQKNREVAKEEILNAAIATKLALNLFQLTKKVEGDNG
jgi:CRISPR-associated protein Cmr5